MRVGFVVQSTLLVLTIAAAGCALVYTEPADPLSRAAFAGDLTRVRALVAAGTNTAALGTALQWAARGGHSAGPHRCGYQLPDRPALVRALLDAGAPVDVPDGRVASTLGSSGWTPLHVALHHSQFDIATVLLERGADPQRKSDQGITPAEMARVAHAPEALMQRLTARPTGARR